MENDNEKLILEDINNRIYSIRNVHVMFDFDLAKLYDIEIKRLTEQVKRNITRFPLSFRFQLTQEESDSLRSQFATIETGRGKHRKYLPYAFTEQGVAMLSAVLRSKTAIEVSIQIMQAFVEMKRFINTNAAIFNRLDRIEIKQTETDIKIQKVFQALEDKSAKPKQGVFYDGQIFDAYIFVADLIKSADKSIVLIDNFIDESVLLLLAKRKKNVTSIIYTNNISKILKQDLTKHNKQYPKITIKEFTKAHDRFLIIDEKQVYHFGASLKDLGKKWFAFSKMEIDAKNILNKLEEGEN